MKSIQKLNLQFGFVGIACNLYTAASAVKAETHNYHAGCLARVKQDYSCTACGKPVPKEETVKGYVDSDEKVVPVTESDLESLKAESDKTVEITECVPLASVDPVYYEKSYYVGPESKDKGAAKAYALFATALAKANLIAVGKIVQRGKESIALVRASQGRLVLSTMYFANEVRDIAEIPAAGTVNESELDLANQLIEGLKADAFDATKYTDAYQERVQALIAAKKAGTVYEAKAAPKQAEVIDLLAALKASLKKGKVAA